MEHCGSLVYTRQRAEEEADKAIAALHALPESDYRLALEGLAHISVHRRFLIIVYGNYLETRIHHPGLSH